jgi:sterol desaturase/sphingolipid hydroxylase (fatty acid hydroxylase superfamily)
MNSVIMGNEAAIRLGCFFGIFLVMALWEVIAPRRPLTQPKTTRWLINLGITFLNTGILRLFFSAGAVGAALFAEGRDWGLFHQVGLPPVLAILLSVLLLDFIIYLQHAVFHFLPLLWRLHVMHHTDLDLDVTSGARFHPLEMLLSMVVKYGAVIVLGTPAVAVLIFEVLLNAVSMFNHANVSIPVPVDRVLRLLIVTPDMHRVHHSVIIREHHSNFGFNLSWWDRILGTYRAQPREGHRGMTLGLANFRKKDELGFLGILAVPFDRRAKGR